MGTKLQKTKSTALITYVIVWLCMVAALFIPVFDNGNMLLKELPAAFSLVTGISLSLPGFFTDFGLTSNYSINLAAWAIVAYAVVIVLGLIALIVICAGKKQSKGIRVVVYITEILSMLSLLLFAYDRLTWIGLGQFEALKSAGQTGWILLAVLGVIWLMFTVQSIYYKRGAGFAKSLLFILSLCALCTLFLSSVAFDISFVAKIADSLKASYYFIGTTSGFTLIKDIKGVLDLDITYLFALVTAIIVLVNLVIDALAIATGTNKGSKIFNLVRYDVELIIAIVTAILGAAKNVTPGIYLYILMVIVLVQIVISTIRMFTGAAEDDDDDDEEDAEEAKAADEKADGEVDEESDEATADEAANEGEKAEGYVTATATDEAPEDDSALANGFYEAPSSTTTPPPVYTRAYTYQDDGFLNSLTPSERAEFYSIFIDKRRGSYYFLPDYEIGGDNREFFQTLFIYLGKFMGSISDGLMNKIYRRLNIID